MNISNDFFDTFHKRHPHRMRIDRALAELGEDACKALMKGEVLVSDDGHRIKPVYRKVRPWINWRHELEQRHPQLAKDILKAHEPVDTLYAEIA